MARRLLENMGTKPGGGVNLNGDATLLGVNQVIPAQGMWSGNNQLGNLTEFAPDSNKRQTILKLDEWGPPEEWTISLYIIDPNGTYDSIGIEAEIHFGAGGSTQIVNVDWNDGVEITKTMNAVNIIAKYTAASGYVAESGTPLMIGAQLGRGARGGTAPVYITLASRVAIAGPSEIAFEIPNFVSYVSFLQSDILATVDPMVAGVKLCGLSGDSALVSVCTGLVTGEEIKLGRVLPITGRTRFVAIRNDTTDDIRITIFGVLYG